MPITLAAITALVALISVALAPRVATEGSFFKGHSPTGRMPGVWHLAFSQVTTWIFARSLMNAAILGYFYGIAGTLAYAAYYLSFLTGLAIVDSLRFRHGFESVQTFLADRFGPIGTAAYNFVIGVRLVSEIFANLLVIGLLFGASGSDAYAWSMLLVAGVTLVYALFGGLHASIRTDVFQFALFLAALVVLIGFAGSSAGFDLPAMLTSSPDPGGPGWVLLGVAALQIWSYPMHDPVMMDRGFIADRSTTRRSFLHAAWISILCILAFGLLGVYGGLNKLEGEDVIASLTRLMGDNPMLLLQVALVVSCMSTLDSTFASAAKLAVVDINWVKPTVKNGRYAMGLFLLGGLAMVYFGSKDLFSAVAVSGTASLFLAPVIFFSLWGGRTDVPVASFVIAFAAAMGGAGLYFAEAAGYVSFMEPLTGLAHKYAKLLAISASVLAIGCGAFALGIAVRSKEMTQ
jgi:solute:Na+ symporter, SSS family